MDPLIHNHHHLHLTNPSSSSSSSKQPIQNYNYHQFPYDAHPSIHKPVVAVQQQQPYQQPPPQVVPAPPAYYHHQYATTQISSTTPQLSILLQASSSSSKPATSTTATTPTYYAAPIPTQSSTPISAHKAPLKAPAPPPVQAQQQHQPAMAWDKKQLSLTLAQCQIPSKYSSAPPPLRRQRDLAESFAVEDDYRDDVLDRLLALENQTQADPAMIDTQPEIKWHMRPHLLDFLFKTHKGLRLNEETLFLAVNIIDRYASQRIVFKRHYQLLGCTALWIASKYHDKKAMVPTLEELKLLCSKVYDSHMFTQMELHILNTLNWNVGHPTVDIFLDMCIGHSQSMSQYPDTLRCAALYLCKVATIHRPFLSFKPSIIASAAFKVATLVLTDGKEDLPAADASEARCIALLLQHLVACTPALELIYSTWEMFIVFQRMDKFYTVRQQQQHYNSPTSNSPITPEQPTFADITPAATPMHKHSSEVLAPSSSSSPYSLHYPPPPKSQQQPSHNGYMTPPFTPEEQNPSPQKVSVTVVSSAAAAAAAVAAATSAPTTCANMTHAASTSSTSVNTCTSSAPTTSIPAHYPPHSEASRALALQNVVAQVPQTQTVFMGFEDYNEDEDEDYEVTSDYENDDDDDDFEYMDADDVDEVMMDLDTNYHIRDVKVPRPNIDGIVDANSSAALWANYHHGHEQSHVPYY